MKKKERVSIHSMKVKELQKAVTDSERALADWMVTRYSKQSKNVREGRAMKRKIAVLKTVSRIVEKTS